MTIYKLRQCHEVFLHHRRSNWNFIYRCSYCNGTAKTTCCKKGDKYIYPRDAGKICGFLHDSMNSFIKTLQWGGIFPWRYSGTPYEKKLLWRRFSPRRRLRKLMRLYGELEHLAEVLPGGIVDILQQVETGKFDVHLDHRGLEPSVNRLVLGMLASALFVGSSLMISRDVPPVIGGFSLLGALGCVFSLALGFRLWLAINKSGHLDRRK